MNLNQRINDHIESIDISRLHNLFIYRDDGINIFTKDEKNKSTIGALVAGVWQASSELSKNVKIESDKEFQFNFYNSNSGVYLISICANSNQYIIGTSYENETNPGKLKLELRRFAKNIETFITKFKNVETKVRTEYLFNEISDHEIDAMFSTVGI
jgi:predicted regulator of Ras-like GTPase activity (Roadblock/LC7/MglB family)